MTKPTLSAGQQAQLAYLGTLPPKFERIHRLVEEIASLRGGDAATKSLCRMLDELRNGASTLMLTPLSDTFGMMSTVARRGSGMQMKVRALREGLASLKINREGALRTASTPVAEPEGDDQKAQVRKAATLPAPSP